MDNQKRQKQRKAVLKFAAAAIVTWGLYWLFEPMLFAAYDVAELAKPIDVDDMSPVDMNDRGDVIGSFAKQKTNAEYIGGNFVVRNASFEELDITGVDPASVRYFTVRAINNAGMVIGTLTTSAATGPDLTRVFSYPSDSKNISFFPWSAGYVAVGINDDGHVIANGIGMRVCGKRHDMTSTAPGPIPIVDVYCDTPSLVIDRAGQIEIRTRGDYSRPTAINKSGQISFMKDEHYRENAINTSGSVTGQWFSGDRYVAFANKPNSAVLNIPTDMNESSGLSINDAGVAIGRQHNSYIVPFLPMPLNLGGYFVYENGKVSDLRIVSGISRFKYSDIDFIKVNNRGQILAQIRSGKRTSAVILTPKS